MRWTGQTIGRRDVSGAYQSARWLTPDELLGSVGKLPVANVRVRSAIFLPSGSRVARIVECLLPGWVTFGGFVVLAGGKSKIVAV